MSNTTTTRDNETEAKPAEPGQIADAKKAESSDFCVVSYRELQLRVPRSVMTSVGQLERA